MISLLADERLRQYDIIAIREEPLSEYWTYRQSALEYLDSPDIRVCFFINTRIEPSTWTVTYHSPYLATLDVKVRGGGAETNLKIHNVYNPPDVKDSAETSEVLTLLQNVDM